MQELNLTPTEDIILLIVCLLILILLWRCKSPQNGADSTSDKEQIETPKDHVRERYGAYIQLQNKYNN